MTGRAPAWGLHLDAPRRGQVLFQLTGFPTSLEATDGLYVAVGMLIGSMSDDRIPVINGLPPPLTTPGGEDLLKALGARWAAPARGIPIYVNTGRAILSELEREGLLADAAEMNLAS